MLHRPWNRMPSLQSQTNSFSIHDQYFRRNQKMSHDEILKCINLEFFSLYFQSAHARHNRGTFRSNTAEVENYQALLEKNC